MARRGGDAVGRGSAMLWPELRLSNQCRTGNCSGDGVAAGVSPGLSTYLWEHVCRP